MIMRKTNRLINDFKNQSTHTIWKFLDAMAVNYTVFSTHLKGFAPFLTDYDVYLYCNDTNMVIVCLDCCGHTEEQVYSESESISSMLFDESFEPRESMVWKLEKTVQLAQARIQETDSDIQVYGAMLTEAEILNAYKLHEMWDANHIMVIDELKRMKYKQIRTNNDDDLSCKAYVDVVTDSSRCQEYVDISLSKEPISTESIQSETQDDDFEKMLNDFINGGFDKTSDSESDEKPSDNESDEKQADNDSDDTIILDEEIEQNNNVSVKVEILRPMAHPRKELNKLVGCADIKRRLDELVALTRYNKMRHDLFPDSKAHKVSLHSVFLGRPGTGKTTVCKIFGSLLHQVGALSKGHVVVCDRSTFIGTLWGDEERSVRRVLEIAKGGVLMIDEAYLLDGKNDNDPGKLVIPQLMNILADETQRDIAVVLCGYKAPMMKLLESNPGLLSRFPNRFEFADFTVEELLEITRRRVNDYQYKFTAKAWEKYSTLLAQAYKMRDLETWGNARFVANQIERIYIQHATRCIKQQPKDKHDLLKLTPEDILPIEIPRQRTKIGF